MKRILIILILLFTAYSNSAVCQTNSSENKITEVDTSSMFPTYKDTLRTSGKRVFVDSADVHIIRGYYVSGAKYLEVYQNHTTKLDYSKKFYENGQLQVEGTMINIDHTYIGIWKYFSSSGNLDSIVDYDKKYPISYQNALSIAEKEGLIMPDLVIRLHYEKVSDKGQTYWEVARWRAKEDESGIIAVKTILIDVNTGKVIIPEYCPSITF
jgi:hypothetical protein